VKGALVQRQGDQHISVTSVEPVAGTCF